MVMVTGSIGKMDLKNYVLWQIPVLYMSAAGR